MDVLEFIITQVPNYRHIDLVQLPVFTNTPVRNVFDCEL